MKTDYKMTGVSHGRQVSVLEASHSNVSTKPEEITCPLCGDAVNNKMIGITYAWSCKKCPFIGFEFYGVDNTRDLHEVLNGDALEEVSEDYPIGSMVEAYDMEKDAEEIDEN